jgi:TolB-like protein/DNA-binding SARP family transcriptional activator
MAGHKETLQLGLLGELSLSRAGVFSDLPPSRKSRALLTWLWLNPGTHRRERIAELLWPDADDPRAGLRWSLNKLRPLLGDALVASRDTVGLERTGINSDLDTLKLLLGSLSVASLPDLDHFLEKLDVGYLPGLDCGDSPEFDIWLQTERSALRELHGQVLDKACALMADDPAVALAYSRRRLAVDPHDVDAILRLLALTRELQGMEAARLAMESARKRLRSAGIDDSSLLRGWRAMTGPAAISAGTAPEGSDLGTHPSFVELALPGKPSLAVLGFDTIGDRNGDVLGRGLTADLISRLSRVGGLFVIARASSTRFSPRDYGIEEIGRRLGVRYLIHGSVQSQGGRLRLNVELLDASDGRDIWVDSIDCPLDDLFLLQERLADSIVSAVEPEIERAEYERARLKQPENLDAWENYHLALWHSFRFTAADTERAQGYLDRALRQDPQFSRAHAALSLVHFSRAFLDSSGKPERDIALALSSAEQSLVLDPRDAMGHWSLGRARFLNCEHDLALQSLDRALAANPNYAQGHYARGFIGVHAGIPVEALSELDRAQRLSPYDPLLFAMKSSRAVSLAIQGDFAAAADWAVRATQEPNAHYHIHAIAAACLELAGRGEQGRPHIETALAHHPGYSRSVFFRSFPYKMDSQQALIDGALARAGLPA